MSEASLMRSVELPQKTTEGHLTMLQELTEAARAENANEDALSEAQPSLMSFISVLSQAVAG